MGLFNPQSGEEQAHCVYHENARFRADLRENKRKTEVRLNLRFLFEWKILQYANLKLKILLHPGKALPLPS